MPRLLSMLPTATILVDEKEREAYAKYVPEEQLHTHKSLNTLTKIRNYINGHYQEDCIVQCDDDLKKVTSTMSGTASTDPKVITAIIENGIQVATDTKLGLIGWSAVANPLQFVPFKPIRLVGAIRACFIIANDARNRRFDDGLVDREDLDFVMQALLKDRVVYIDSRFYFDFGNCMSGMGGLQGKRTDDNFAKSEALMRQKWGNYFSSKVTANSSSKAGSRLSRSKNLRSQHPRRSLPSRP